MKKVIVIGLIALAAVGLGVVLFMVSEEENPALRVQSDFGLPQMGEAIEDQGREHIDVGAQHNAYNSNPPTSGPHYATPANWGVYQNPLADEQLVHNLEHGGIWISYKLDIDAETKAKLEAIGKANPGSTIITPRDQNDSKIAVASWTRLMKLDNYDEQRILDFIKANKNKSPEPLAN